jgi:hypothetical protein
MRRPKEGCSLGLEPCSLACRKACVELRLTIQPHTRCARNWLALRSLTKFSKHDKRPPPSPLLPLSLFLMVTRMHQSPVKLARSGKVKSGRSLNGSQLWKAQHKLHDTVESTTGTSGALDSTSYLTNNATEGGPCSKRTPQAEVARAKTLLTAMALPASCLLQLNRQKMSQITTVRS